MEYFEEYGRIVTGPLITVTENQKTTFIEFDDYDPVDKLFCEYQRNSSFKQFPNFLHVEKGLTRKIST